MTVLWQANATTLIGMNGLHNLGTVLSNMVQLDECFENWNGKCAGERLGNTIYGLLDTSIITVWDALENDSYI